MKPAELKARWSDGPGADFVRQLVLQAPLGGEIRSSPFGLHAGRFDLRGLSLPEGITLRGQAVHSVDLGGATLVGTWLETCTFVDVVFDNVAAMEVADHGNRFKDCSFSKTDFRVARLGYRGSQFLRCTFVKANFRRAGFIRPEFDDVDFTDCRLQGVDFNGASFRRCTFSGEVRDVWFRGGYGFPGQYDSFGRPRHNTMEDVSFENARLSGVTFSDGCELGTVKLPLDGSCYRFDRWRERLERLRDIGETRAAEEREEIMAFCYVHLVHAATQDAYILSEPELRAEYGERTAREILGQLAAFDGAGE